MAANVGGSTNGKILCYVHSWKLWGQMGPDKTVSLALTWMHTYLRLIRESVCSWLLKAKQASQICITEMI